jgi:hypothetical protein
LFLATRTAVVRDFDGTTLGGEGVKDFPGQNVATVVPTHSLPGRPSSFVDAMPAIGLVVVAAGTALPPRQ